MKSGPQVISWGQKCKKKMHNQACPMCCFLGKPSIGSIVNIVLHPDEPQINNNNSVIKLKYLLLYILVKLSRTRTSCLAGLDECVVPIKPRSASYVIKLSVGSKTIQHTVKRQQFLVTAAYVFTDYRSQGQTIPYVIVDISTPPTGGLNLFNLYVVLSQSRGHNLIWLLRDFNKKIF